MCNAPFGLAFHARACTLQWNFSTIRRLKRVLELKLTIKGGFSYDDISQFPQFTITVQWFWCKCCLYSMMTPQSAYCRSQSLWFTTCSPTRSIVSEILCSALCFPCECSRLQSRKFTVWLPSLSLQDCTCGFHAIVMILFSLAYACCCCVKWVLCLSGFPVSHML